MKILPIILLFISIRILANENEFCQRNPDHNNFLSTWKDKTEDVILLTSVYGSETFISTGQIAYKGDLNRDGNDDYIFESLQSQGSAKDRTHGIYIACKGFLKFTGGEYFAGVHSVIETEGGFNKIIFLSYSRDNSGNIRYKNDKMLTKRHTWSFNPESGKYEGDID